MGGYIGFTPSVRLSVRPSVPLSHIPFPLCNVYSSSWIHFIFTHLIKQFQNAGILVVLVLKLSSGAVTIYTRGLIKFINQYRSCWCPGDSKSEGICDHSIDIKYLGLSHRKAKNTIHFCGQLFVKWQKITLCPLEWGHLWSTIHAYLVYI